MARRAEDDLFLIDFRIEALFPVPVPDIAPEALWVIDVGLDQEKRHADRATKKEESKRES